MSLKLSIIVPVYNVEKYIGMCLNSIILSAEEYMEQIEIVIIDDRGADNSMGIVEEYASKFNNIHIARHKQNMGPGAARNTGVLLAKGEYLWFIDSDDFISQTAIQTVFKYLMGLDVLLFNYANTDVNGNVSNNNKFFLDKAEQSGLDYIKNGGFGGSITNHLGYVVRLIIRRKYWIDANILFPEYVYWEDTLPFAKVILQAEYLKSISEVLYYYRYNSDSISGDRRKLTAKKIFDFSFPLGCELKDFSSTIVDKSLSQEFAHKADWYINRWLLNLLRTSWKERFAFRKMINDNATVLLTMKYQNKINKLLLKPYIGACLVELMAFVYKMKHINIK